MAATAEASSGDSVRGAQRYHVCRKLCFEDLERGVVRMATGLGHWTRLDMEWRWRRLAAATGHPCTEEASWRGRGVKLRAAVF